jgi:hypothetical protein
MSARYRGFLVNGSAKRRQGDDIARAIELWRAFLAERRN